MKQVRYKIFSGEKSVNYPINIGEDLFRLLEARIGVYESINLVSPSIAGKINSLEEKLIEISFDLLYDLLEKNLGIGLKDIDELTVEDYQTDKIIVHVYLLEL